MTERPALYHIGGLFEMFGALILCVFTKSQETLCFSGFKGNRLTVNLLFFPFSKEQPRCKACNYIFNLIGCCLLPVE